MNPRRFVILLFCLYTFVLGAQELTYPIDTIGGKPFYRYVVEKGVGLYRVSKIFNVPQEMILEANPDIQQKGLVYGETILVPIPVKEIELVKQKTKKPIIKFVENVEPILEEEPIVEDSALQMIVADTLRLAIMLPLHANTTQRNASMERFVEFYMGALLAIYEAQQAGQSIVLHTYDVEKTTNRLQEILSDSTWHNVDAIIGPAYGPQVQKMISFTERDSTWLLVPFLSDIVTTHTNPNVFQFNPSSQTEAKVLAEYLATCADSVNCVLIQPKEGESVPKSIQYLHTALRQQNVSITTTTIREVLADSIDGALVEGKENIVIFNTEKYANLQAVIPHLLRIVGQHKITLYSRYSWQTEKIVLPQIYTSVFQEDMIGVDSYDVLYQSYFKSEPSAQSPRYDLLGYDLTKHFILLLQSDDTHGLQDTWTGLQSAIQYQPSSLHAGYENQKITIIRK